MKKIQKAIKKNGRIVELKNVWLLYNFDNYCEYFWAKKQAWAEAYQNNFNKKDTKEIYQVLRGDIKITIHGDPYYEKPKAKKIKITIYHCDGCGKKIVKLSGRAFQCGVNKKGEIATWCGEKCFKQKRLKKE